MKTFSDKELIYWGSFTAISLIKVQYFKVKVSFVNYELDISSFIAFQAFLRRLKNHYPPVVLFCALKSVLRPRSHGTGRIRDRAQIRPNPPCVHTGPLKSNEFEHHLPDEFATKKKLGLFFVRVGFKVWQTRVNTESDKVYSDVELFMCRIICFSGAGNS